MSTSDAEALHRLAGSDAISLRPDAIDAIRRLADIVKPIDGPRGVHARRHPPMARRERPHGSFRNSRICPR